MNEKNRGIMLSGLIEDARLWLFANEVAAALAHRLDKVTATRVVSTVVIDTAASRLRTVGVTLEDARAIVHEVYGKRKR